MFQSLKFPTSRNVPGAQLCDIDRGLILRTFHGVDLKVQRYLLLDPMIQNKRKRQSHVHDSFLVESFRLVFASYLPLLLA